MKPEVRELVQKLTDVISKWNCAECISLNEAASANVLDSYFAVILDAYYSGELPSARERAESYGDNIAFETSAAGKKDRFIVGDIPVRIEYKDTEKINQSLRYASAPFDELWNLKSSGTYVFYRLLYGETLFKKTRWMDDAQAAASSLEDGFWTRMRDFYQSTMEHYLMDLGAAVVQNDPFHYLVSSAGFIKYSCSALFMINRRFEPSHRSYEKQTLALEILPEDFRGRFECFLRPDNQLPPERKYSIAQLIAKSIVVL